MLDKNPEEKQIGNINDIVKIFEKNTLTSVTYTDPFLKIAFFLNFFPLLKIPIIYLDFDLLYSGYVSSGLISNKKEISLIQPTKDNWNEIFKKTLSQLCKQKSVIVVDSLNSFSTMFYEKSDVGRWFNSVIMLLVSFAKMSDSFVLCTSMAHRRKDEEWVLSITGRLLTEIKNSTIIHLNLKNSKIILDSNFTKSDGKSYELPIKISLF